jgi:hypothetical protein
MFDNMVTGVQRYFDVVGNFCGEAAQPIELDALTPVGAA